MSPSDNTNTAGSQRASVVIERDAGRPAVELSLEVPEGWRASQSYGPNTFEPIEQPDSRVYTSVVVRVIERDQTLSDARAQVEAAIQRHTERAERPNVNSGEPELDAVRAQVSVVEHEDFDGGVSHILRVEYSDEVMASGPYRPYISTACYHHDDDRDYIVELSGRMPLAAEDRFLPDVQKLCRSVQFGR